MHRGRSVNLTVFDARTEITSARIGPESTRQRSKHYAKPAEIWFIFLKEGTKGDALTAIDAQVIVESIHIRRTEFSAALCFQGLEWF
jgi:hypothetical protein